MTADEDFDIWIEDSEMSSATAQPRFLTVYQVGIPAWTSSKGTRYKIERSTLSTLPHKDTPLSIKKGQVVIFSSFGGNSENPNGYDDFMFHTNKVWFTKTIYRNTPYIKYSRSTVDLKPQEKEVLFIYTPCKGGYIKYRYSHVYNKTINCDSWHLGIVSICDDMMNELYDISHIGEIEMAVKLSGRVDYMGGLAHGDEVVVDNGFTINNVEYSLSNLIEEFGEDAKPVTNVMCRQTSHMYDPALSATLDNVSTLSSIATHQKTLVWNKDSDLSIGQTIEWNKNDTLFDGAFPMLTPRKYNVESNGISSVITDTLNTLLSTYDIEHAWDKASITNRSLNTGISSVTVFGKESGIRFHAECSQYVNDEPVSTQFSLRDNGGNNYNKIYFLMNNDDKAKNISNGDIWKSNCLISITK